MKCACSPTYARRLNGFSLAGNKELNIKTQHTDLYFIRHGETDSNVNGLLHGITDVALNETGLAQARLIARRLAEIEYLDRIIASPLQRARVTAEIIAEATGLPLTINPDLHEMNFGVAEGEPFHELGNVYPELSHRFLDPSDLDVKYPDGESRREFFGRIERAVDGIATSHLGEDVVVVAHGGFISAMLTVLLKDNPNNWRDHPIRNCSLTHIEFATEGLTAHIIDDVVHLDQEVDLLTDSVGDAT